MGDIIIMYIFFTILWKLWYMYNLFSVFFFFASRGFRWLHTTTPRSVSLETKMNSSKIHLQWKRTVLSSYYCSFLFRSYHRSTAIQFAKGKKNLHAWDNCTDMLQKHTNTWGRVLGGPWTYSLRARVLSTFIVVGMSQSCAELNEAWFFFFRQWKCSGVDNCLLEKAKLRTVSQQLEATWRSALAIM